MIKHIFNILNPIPGLQQIWNARELLINLVKRNISVRYKGSMLGVLWSIVQPLMMLCIYTYVFSVVFKARWGENVGSSKGGFAIILFCGMALYSVFSESITLSSTQITSNVNFVKKVVFPLQLLPLAQVLSSFVLGGIWLILLLFGAVFIFGNISWSMLLLPLVLLPFFLFTLGIAFLFPLLQFISGTCLMC